MKKILSILNKKNKSKIVCLTAYSKNIAKLIDDHCDLVLVGDSLANVLYGMKNTHQISMDIMLNHAKSARAGVKNSLLVVDMPKNSYKNPSSAVRNAKYLIKKSGCEAVKIESNFKNSNIIKALVKSKIAVMGHIGFTPQFKKKFSVQGTNLQNKKKLILDAKKIENAGAFSIVLECIKKETAKQITQALKIPTIGIGSSNYCDGQVLVTEDLIGLSGFYPRFVKKYANISKIIKKSVQKYKKEVISKRFPSKNNSY